ncbi:MAG: hypothetical protein M3468_13220 [Acidobacteriota bacterium]|nr:hypothetical protein [Acidobacteriota bacterium]
MSILDSELIQDVTFLSGGYPAPYVNRTSSVLQIAQREGSREHFRGWGTLGFAGAGTILEGPIDGGRGSWILSARRSFLDIFTNDIGIVSRSRTWSGMASRLPVCRWTTSSRTARWCSRTIRARGRPP